MKISRRNFLFGGALGISSLGASGFYVNSIKDTTESLAIEKVNIKINTLPKEFENYRIGFISDIHLGVSMSEEFVHLAFDTIVKEKIDLLLLGGDYVWIPESFIARSFENPRSPRFRSLSPHNLNISVFDELQKIINSFVVPDGILAVLGNHDRWSDPLAAQDSFRSSKGLLLENKKFEIKRGDSKLNIFGVKDYLTDFPEVPESELNLNETNILLSHNPDFVTYVPKSIFDLAICGHTHGGQINLPGFRSMGLIYANIEETTLFSGLNYWDDMPVYTSRGLGVVEIPYRINCTPEISVLELISA